MKFVCLLRNPMLSNSGMIRRRIFTRITSLIHEDRRYCTHSFSVRGTDTNKSASAVVISETADKYHDLIVAAISSSIPQEISTNEFIVEPSKENGLRVRSVIK